jgi:glycosyltransferase involved in cell wall biosynthesis
VAVISPTVRALPAVSASRTSALLAGMGVRGAFVLYPAAAYPHKNHIVLLNAFAQVVKDHDLTLVLTGAVGAGAWGSAHSTQPTIDATATALGIAGRLRQLGYVTTEQLAALYSRASMLTFPSRFEGFGIPVVEAMASGCPVIAADASALPAVVGDAGVVVEPDDVDAWAAAIVRVLDDRAHRDALVAAGHARAIELAQTDRAQQLVDVYQRAVV